MTPAWKNHGKTAFNQFPFSSTIHLLSMSLCACSFGVLGLLARYALVSGALTQIAVRDNVRLTSALATPRPQISRSVVFCLLPLHRCVTRLTNYGLLQAAGAQALRQLAVGKYEVIRAQGKRKQILLVCIRIRSLSVLSNSYATVFKTRRSKLWRHYACSQNHRATTSNWTQGDQAFMVEIGDPAGRCL